jgi:hypothetical protein
MGTDDLFHKRRKESSFLRKKNIKSPKEIILIVCEGEKTEKQYFEGFPVQKEIVKVDVAGKGYNTDSLVKEAIRLREEAKSKGKFYNQVWCVFDRDSFPPQNFNNAFILAKTNGIKIAYSNEAFELWHLLHFNLYENADKREYYKERLSKLIGKKYEKNDPGMYEILLKYQKKAISNAKKLYSKYTSPNPEKDNPSTTVFKLVEELNRYISKC